MPTCGGDIAKTAGLTVEESSTRSPRFSNWELHPHSHKLFPMRAGQRQSATTMAPVGE
jgi:hypothetical protein